MTMWEELSSLTKVLDLVSFHKYMSACYKILSNLSSGNVEKQINSFCILSKNLANNNYYSLDINEEELDGFKVKLGELIISSLKDNKEISKIKLPDLTCKELLNPILSLTQSIDIPDNNLVIDLDNNDYGVNSCVRLFYLLKKEGENLVNLGKYGIILNEDFISKPVLKKLSNLIGREVNCLYGNSGNFNNKKLIFTMDLRDDIKLPNTLNISLYEPKYAYLDVPYSTVAYDIEQPILIEKLAKRLNKTLIRIVPFNDICRGISTSNVQNKKGELEILSDHYPYIEDDYKHKINDSEIGLIQVLCAYINSNKDLLEESNDIMYYMSTSDIVNNLIYDFERDGVSSDEVVAVRELTVDFFIRVEFKKIQEICRAYLQDYKHFDLSIIEEVGNNFTEIFDSKNCFLDLSNFDDIAVWIVSTDLNKEKINRKLLSRVIYLFNVQYEWYIQSIKPLLSISDVSIGGLTKEGIELLQCDDCKLFLPTTMRHLNLSNTIKIIGKLKNQSLVRKTPISDIRTLTEDLIPFDMSNSFIIVNTETLIHTIMNLNNYEVDTGYNPNIENLKVDDLGEILKYTYNGGEFEIFKEDIEV